MTGPAGRKNSKVEMILRNAGLSMRDISTDVVSIGSKVVVKDLE